MLSDMELTDAFDADIRVPPITSLTAVDHVLREVELFRSEEEYQTAKRLLQQAGFAEEGRLNVGVKKLLSMAEMARQDPNPAEKLVGSLIQHSA
jgi:vesicle-fusing ATPase